MNEKPRINLRLSHRSYMFLTDILLSLIFLLLFSLLLTGLKIHELAGIAFFVLMLLHLVFSWTWIKLSAQKILRKKNWQKRFNFLLNATLFILVVLQVSSGLVISQVAVPALGIKTINDWAWRSLHSDCPRILVVVISLHIALNWQRIAGYFRKKNLTSIPSATSNGTAPVAVFANGLRIAVLILLAAAVVAVITFIIKGQPLEADKVPWNAIARFTPMLIPGLVQYSGGAIVICILVYMAHRWLKLRL